MARIRFSPLVLAVTLLALSTDVALAQFDTIFGRPSRPQNDPGQLPPPPDQGTDPRFPNSGQVLLPPPPQTPGTIQSQPLPPPPGATASQPATTGPQQPTAQPPLFGLPPGQRQPRGEPQQAALPRPEDVIAQPPSQKIENPIAVFSGLDKITGRITKFDVAINETVRFGALQVTPRACYTRPPTETPNTDGFVEVEELTLKGELRRIFTGWMFASSPGLHAVEHPIYDVWLIDCKGAETQVAAVDDGSATTSPGTASNVPLPPARPSLAP